MSDVKLSELLVQMAKLTPSEAASAGMRIAAEEVVKLESENARLAARVTELETLTADCHDVMVACKRRESELREQVADLQSQLAWTPVSAGLPTEPGMYEFYDATGRYMIGIYELTPGVRWYTAKVYTHYRRIEIPEAV